MVGSLPFLFCHCRSSDHYPRISGSIAAGIQSVFYGGMTTGLFSVCQSVAATAVAPSLASVVSAAGSAAAGATLLGSRGGSGPSDNDTTRPPEDQ